MKVLIVLYDGFTEYEYQLPLLAFYHFNIPFDIVGLNSKEIKGMIDLKASLPKTLREINSAEYTALFLPGLDAAQRDEIAQNNQLLSLIQEFA